MGARHLQGRDLIRARQKGTLTLSLTRGDQHLTRSVTIEDVWSDPDVVKTYGHGLVEMLVERIDEVAHA